MPDRNQLVYNKAVADFKRARKKAAMRVLMGRLTGQQNDLLAYDDVYTQLKGGQVINQGVEEIPLDAIVGSVGRYKDFTRDFLPKHDSNEERWAQVRKAVVDMTGLPPIDVYKLGDAYFVIDGNHRVSVARELGTKTITARVTEVSTRVPLMPDDDPDQIICKARYAEFLEATNLDLLRPDADLYMTFCGHFRVFLAQIEAYTAIVEQTTGESVTEETAVCRWYDEVYLPVIQYMRERGVMHYFPERTEADLYILLTEKRASIAASLGWEVDSDETVEALAVEKEQSAHNIANRLFDVIKPIGLADGPVPGHWREFQLSRKRDRLFADYLVALSGREAEWSMLEQIIRLAERDDDRILGLHIVPHAADLDSASVADIRSRFAQVCAAGGVSGELAVEVGDGVVESIISRAVWADLVILSLKHPGERTLGRLGNRTRRIIQRCPRPLLILPAWVECPMDRVLLAYDGSPKAEEALFVAAYLKSRWPMTLTILTVVTENTTAGALEKAGSYLEEQGILDATLVLKEKPISRAILDTAAEFDINYLIMGGFGFRPFKHLLLGSTVDDMLRQIPQPILICR